MNQLVSLFRFKAWANAELLDALAGIDVAAHETALHAAIRTLNHTHVVDQIFRAHLQGEEHGFAGTNTSQTPTLVQLKNSMTAVDDWYLSYARDVTPAQLTEIVTFTFTDGDAGRMSREEILMHVLVHGGYHRGAIGQILRGMGKAPPRELYTRFLHNDEPERRS